MEDQYSASQHSLFYICVFVCFDKFRLYCFPFLLLEKEITLKLFFLINYVVLLLICRVIAVFPPPPAVGKIQILKMDLETLEDGKEVNDSVVDLFLM